MSLQKQDYEDFSDQVVDGFLEAKKPLNGSILKIAKENDLNPDQIKRLVEMSNIKAFLKIFNKPESKEKNIEFDVAEPEAILKDYYKPTGKSISITKITISGGGGGEDFHSDLPDMMRAKRHGAVPEHKIEKTAEEVAAVRASQPKREVAEFRLRKVAEEFKNKIYELEHDYQEGLDKLASEFRKDYGPNYQEFEKTALHVHGTGVMSVIEDIRSAARCKTPVYDLEKAAARVFIDDDTPQHVIFNKMIENKYDQVKYAKASKLAGEKLRSLR